MVGLSGIRLEILAQSRNSCVLESISVSQSAGPRVEVKSLGFYTSFIKASRFQFPPLHTERQTGFLCDFLFSNRPLRIKALEGQKPVSAMVSLPGSLCTGLSMVVLSNGY